MHDTTPLFELALRHKASVRKSRRTIHITQIRWCIKSVGDLLSASRWSPSEYPLTPPNGTGFSNSASLATRLFVETSYHSMLFPCWSFLDDPNPPIKIWSLSAATLSKTRPQLLISSGTNDIMHRSGVCLNTASEISSNSQCIVLDRKLKHTFLINLDTTFFTKVNPSEAEECVKIR